MNDDKKLKFKFYISSGALILLGVLFAIINGIDIRNWMDSPWDSILISLWLVSAFFFGLYSRRLNESEYEKYRQLLIKKINSGFCPCTERCDHKEEFMKYMDGKYGIKLYY